MNGFVKGLVTMALIIYIVSPIDAAPGHIDDVFLILLAMASNKAAEE